MTLKEKIRVLANSKGMSLPNLESELGFGNGTILKWDKSAPNTDKLARVADYFGVSIDYLLGRKGEISFTAEFESDEEAKIYLDILSSVEKLNIKGMKEANRYLTYLSMQREFVSKDDLLLNAAHEIEGATEDEKKHDDDIMDDDNF